MTRDEAQILVDELTVAMMGNAMRVVELVALTIEEQAKEELLKAPPTNAERVHEQQVRAAEARGFVKMVTETQRRLRLIADGQADEDIVTPRQTPLGRAIKAQLL